MQCPDSLAGNEDPQVLRLIPRSDADISATVQRRLDQCTECFIPLLAIFHQHNLIHFIGFALLVPADAYDREDFQRQLADVVVPVEDDGDVGLANTIPLK